MKNVYLLRSFAALAMGMILASCSSDDFEQQPTEAEAVTIAEEKLGFTFDPNQDWSMTQSGSIDVTVNAGIDANEVLILDALPYGDNESHILGHADVEEGQTVTVNYVAPKAIKYFYVACRNAQKNYRFVYAEVGATSASFANTTRAMASRRDGANVSVDEEGYNTFNSELALSWEGVIAAERTGTNGFTYFLFMGDFVPWKSSGWTDKFHQITAPVVDSDITDQEASDLSNLIKSVIPEGENNLAKAKYTGYSITTTGGPVTLTPIFKNSNSGDRISYYYYPEGTTPTVEQIKAMKKYTIGEMADPQVCNTDNYSFYKKTYSLVYEAPDGSVSENFPKGLVINFIISNTWIGERQRDIYESGGITTSSSTTITSNSWYKVTVDPSKTYRFGDYLSRYNQVDVLLGRSDWADVWGAPANPYNNFYTKTSSAIDGYSARLERIDSTKIDGFDVSRTDLQNNGKSLNGSLDKLGATTYFIKPTNFYFSDGFYTIKAALRLNSGKGLYIYELDDYTSTTGTIVSDFENKMYSQEDILVEFPVKADKVYAIFAGGSKLSFYGCELFFNKEENTGASTTTVSDVVKKTIDCHQDYYGDGRMNVEVHQSGSWGFNDYSHGITDPQTPHSAVFEYGGRTFVGFEDWVDFDFNDVIYEIKGAEGGEEIVPGEPFIPIYSYAFEDTRYGDYDMNDVVLKVREDGDDIVLKLVATGAALDLNIRLYDNAGEDGMEYGSNFITLSYNDKIEVHEMLGVEHGYLTNTGADNNEGANAYPIEIRVPKANYADYRKLRLAIYIPTQQGKEDYEMRLAGSGQAPYGVIIPEDWKWPREFVNITIAYPEFKGFAETAGANEDWYKTPSENYVMDESDL
jgi:hypothetical protein